jgi:predicted RNA-binding Zn-ribbon protein involved in translation (DUF1610 family)
MTTEARIAAAKGIEPCPMCGSSDVRWRRRGPTDFALTWLRWWVELFASFFQVQARSVRRSSQARAFDATTAHTQVIRIEYGTGAGEPIREFYEATTGHKTPKRFWRCSSCKQKGHVF